jgi:hypothetical protein
VTEPIRNAKSDSDLDVQRRVVLFLAQRRLVCGTRLSVDVQRGVVTLRGLAPTFHQRQLIVAFARRVAGAVQVIDELEVDPPRTVSLPSRAVDPKMAALASTVALIASMYFAGCGGGGPPRVPTQPARGSISFQGRPIGGAFLALHRKAAAEGDAPTATAVVQPDGTFSVGTYEAHDGLPTGDYVVTVQWRRATKSGDEWLPGPNLLPARYSQVETSHVVVHVAAGENALPPIVLKR